MRETTSSRSGLVSVLVKGGLIIGAAWLATRYFSDRAGEVGSRWDWPRSDSGEGWSWPRTSSRAGQWDWPSASDGEDPGRASRAGSNPSA